jgi:hypothetical protein
MSIDLENRIMGLPNDLPEMELTNIKETIKGKGIIYLAENGVIELKLFVDNPKPFNIVTFFQEFNENKEMIGKIISDESYYTFTGTATNNNLYTCKRVHITNHDNYKVYTAEICSELYITDSTDSVGSKIAKIEIPYQIKIPKNHVIETERKYSDKWRSRSGSLEIFEILLDNQSIDIFTSDDCTSILIQNVDIGTLEKEIPMIINTLGFITASIIDRYVIEYGLREGKFRREFHYFHKQRPSILTGLPPLWISSSIDRKNYNLLFVDFYTFLSKNNDELLIETLDRIISAQNSFITNYALTVTTAIETIINNYYPKKRHTIKKADITLAIKEINGTNISDNLKNRIVGMLGNIAGQLRADDVIKELVDKGTINKKFYSEWKILRNSVNHGKKPSSDYQIYFNLCESNLVFYYSLILNLIKYNGQYSDYSTYGHPLIKIM